MYLQAEASNATICDTLFDGRGGRDGHRIRSDCRRHRGGDYFHREHAGHDAAGHVHDRQRRDQQPLSSWVTKSSRTDALLKKGASFLFQDLRGAMATKQKRPWSERDRKSARIFTHHAPAQPIYAPLNITRVRPDAEMWGRIARRQVRIAFGPFQEAIRLPASRKSSRRDMDGAVP